MFNSYNNKTLLDVKILAQHPFHVLTNSKLPIFIASLAGLLAVSFVSKLHSIDFTLAHDYNLVSVYLLEPFFSAKNLNYLSINTVIFVILGFLTTAMLSWSYNLISESTSKGHHTLRVQLALKFGMLLFLVSEAMLFFPFFWAFFHGSLAPSVTIGAIWPPVGIDNVEILNPFMLPLLNTVVLLCSGVAIIGAHRAIITGHKTMILNTLYTAISLGILFSLLQFLEYGLTKFTINDGLYGSVFFMLTGLHGFHVIVGTTLLIISYFRTADSNFSTSHHIGFETAAWYWHFVDVVWLGVFIFIYIWGI